MICLLIMKRNLAKKKLTFNDERMPSVNSFLNSHANEFHFLFEFYWLAIFPNPFLGHVWNNLGRLWPISFYESLRPFTSLTDVVLFLILLNAILCIIDIEKSSWFILILNGLERTTKNSCLNFTTFLLIKEPLFIFSLTECYGKKLSMRFNALTVLSTFGFIRLQMIIWCGPMQCSIVRLQIVLFK